MQLSQKGEHFLANQEGKQVNDKGLHIPYKCIAGKWTLGYGEVISPEQVEQFKAGITEEEALKRFRLKYKQFVDAVNKNVRVPLTQNQFDMLVSLAYNIGVVAFGRSTVLSKVNSRLFTQAADHFLDWCKFTNPVNGKIQTSKGLLARREREKAIFLTKE